MLDTQFPRILGDVGNPKSYNFPTRTCVVHGAGSLDIVRNGLPSKNLIADFCAAAKKLEVEGAFAIISSCGFLISVQEQIDNAVNIPVMVSALSLYTQIESKLEVGASVGILTASSKDFGNLALGAAGIKRENIQIAGMEDCPAFANAILREKEEQLIKLDKKSISAAVVKKALSLQKSDPQIGALLLECGNLPPYTDALKFATGLPVYSILDVAENFNERFHIKHR